MKEFFKALDTLHEEAAAESEQKFRHRVMCRICKFFGIESPPDSEDEATWNWFEENYPRFPVRLESRKIVVSVGQMFSAMLKTEAWDAYWEIFDESSVKLLAVFVPAKGHGIFVLHNCWHLPATPGYTRLSRVAKAGEKGIIFEPAEAFLESVRNSGWAP